MIERLKRFRTFCSETWVELKKTTWPSKKDVTGTTIVVIVTVLICAAYLYVVDKALSEAMQWVFQAFTA